MQAATVPSFDRDASNVESRKRFSRLFATYWDDVQHLNSYSPEAARALLGLEGTAGTANASAAELESDNLFNDPWTAVRVGLRERAAGRLITRNA